MGLGPRAAQPHLQPFFKVTNDVPVSRQPSRGLHFSHPLYPILEDPHIRIKGSPACDGGSRTFPRRTALWRESASPGQAAHPAGSYKYSSPGYRSFSQRRASEDDIDSSSLGQPPLRPRRRLPSRRTMMYLSSACVTPGTSCATSCPSSSSSKVPLRSASKLLNSSPKRTWTGGGTESGDGGDAHLERGAGGDFGRRMWRGEAAMGL